MMTDADCVQFLQRALPRIDLRWSGFRKVHKLLCKRLRNRLAELSLSDVSAYRDYLESHAEEWRTFDAFCRITISRCYRDREVFDVLGREVLPALAERAVIEQRDHLACWSACCASGEEPYSLGALWHMRLRQRYPQLSLRVIATEIDAQLLERARRGCYTASSVKEVPSEWLGEVLTRRDAHFCVREALRTVEFMEQDIRNVVPDGIFDLILCRNAVLTYFAPALQRAVMERVITRLRTCGVLVVGIHESLPDGMEHLTPWPAVRAIYRKVSGAVDVLDRSAMTSSSST
jgi:chemotaxis protein methyltransferase CheR